MPSSSYPLRREVRVPTSVALIDWPTTRQALKRR
jgi:hypothetical protein